MDVCGYIKTKALHTSSQNPALREEKRKSLLAFHAITGFDTTSQFYGVGKASAWKVFEDVPDLLEHLGEESQISADVLILLKLKPLYESSTIREHKRWKPTNKEHQRFVNPRKILTPYLQLRMRWSPVLLSQSLKTVDGTTVKAFRSQS